MSDYAITIKGLDEAVRKFDTALPVVRYELYRAMYRAVTGELGRMPSYPPPPPASTYVRTLLLGRSLTSMVGQADQARSRVEGDGANIRGYVGTAVQYAPDVIGNNQARPHRGRWWRLEASVLSHKRQLEAEFEAAAQTITERLATG